jgi:hypothetical protein
MLTVEQIIRADRETRRLNYTLGSTSLVVFNSV